jgi:putative DNA primase/helicase
MTTEILYAAEQYCSLGWRLIPLYAEGSQAKHPRIRRWPERATAEVEKVRNWFYSFRDQEGMIAFGLACGKDSGIFVLDIDDPTEWQKLTIEHGELPDTIESQTGGGGSHYFFKYPTNGEKVATGTGVPCRGVDIRGDGGQVVLPPAPHQSGMEYQWIHSPEDTKIADAPKWLLELIKEAASDQEWAELHDVWYERQNDHLHHWARVLVHAGNTDVQIKDIFRRKLEDGGLPNLDPTEPWTLPKVLMPVESGIAAARKQLSVPLSASGGGGTDGMGTGGHRLQFGTPRGLTDADNALRLRHHFGHQLRYATGLGWSTWDEHRWRLDRERLWVMRYAEQTTKKIQAESGTLTGDDAKKVRNWARLSRNMPRLNAMITLSQGLEGVMQDVDDFDASPTEPAEFPEWHTGYQGRKDPR